MNRIVRENYPVSKLPEDLREGLSPDDMVRIVIQPAAPPEGHLSRFVGRFGRHDVSPDEAAARIRALRDEWD